MPMEIETAGAAPQGATRLYAERFREGLDFDRTWSLMSRGPEFTADDGTVRETARGLTIAAGDGAPNGRDPAFTKSQTGQLAHLKWLAKLQRPSSSGLPGFDVRAGARLHFSLRAGARTFGTEGHPFGDAVADPQSDPRLGAGVMNVMDYETGLVLDFWITNTAIHPFYERLHLPGPFEGAQAFTSIFPSVARTPDAVHDLCIVVGGDGSAQFRVDGETVASVGELGRPAPGATIVLDHGGTPSRDVPRQMTFGVGLMTLLDAGLPPGDEGLVDFGVHCTYPTRFRGGPDVFGQGAALEIEEAHIDEYRETEA